MHPFTLDVLQPRLPMQAWADGQLVWAVDFGADRFRVNDNFVVQEVALFRLALLGSDGQPKPLDVPPVVGTGPLRTPRAADAPNGFPRFGALRHEYYAVVTAAAGGFTPGVFVSASRPALREQLIAQLGAALVPVPSGAAAFRIGYFFGLGLYGIGASWVYVSLNRFGAMPMPLAAAATLAWCAFLALFPALAGWVRARIARDAAAGSPSTAAASPSPIFPTRAYGSTRSSRSRTTCPPPPSST